MQLESGNSVKGHLSDDVFIKAFTALLSQLVEL